MKDVAMKNFSITLQETVFVEFTKSQFSIRYQIDFYRLKYGWTCMKRRTGNDKEICESESSAAAIALSRK